MKLLDDSPARRDLQSRVKHLEMSAMNKLATEVGILGRAYFIRRGLSIQDAEDLAQGFLAERYSAVVQAFLKKDPEPFGKWLYTCFLNCFRNHFRALGRQVPTLPLLEIDAEPAAPDTETPVASRNGVLSDEEHRALNEALEKLSPEQRKLLLFQADDPGLPNTVIARELGMTAVNGRVTAHRARARLRKLLAADPRMRDWIARH